MIWLLAQIGKILILIISLILSLDFIITTQPELTIQCIIMFAVGYIDKELLDIFTILGQRDIDNEEGD